MCLTPWSISARTIIAAPVIWFGSWLWSLMACSGCAVASGFLCLVREIKKGLKRARAHRLMWMASAIPGGAPRYHHDKKLGNFIAHLRCHLPEGCADHSPGPQNVKRSRQLSALGGP